MKITLVVDFPGRKPAVNRTSQVHLVTNGKTYPGTLASVTYSDLGERYDALEAERDELQAQLGAIREGQEQQGCEEMPDHGRLDDWHSKDHGGECQWGGECVGCNDCVDDQDDGEPDDVCGFCDGEADHACETCPNDWRRP